MKQQTNLSQRVKRAQAAAIFATTERALPDGRPRSVLLPGREGRRSGVVLRRRADMGAISCECRLQTGCGEEACPGNGQGTVCYHCLAALLFASQANGKNSKNSKNSLRFCGTKNDADRLSRLGGRVIQIVAWQGQGAVWAVAS